MSAESEKMPAPSPPTTESFGRIARYLALADIALNSDHGAPSRKTARFEDSMRAEQQELEERIRRVIENYRARNRQAAADLGIPTHRRSGTHA